MAKEKETAPKLRKYRNACGQRINVNGQPRDPMEEFEELETQELLNLTQHKYLELIK